MNYSFLVKSYSVNVIDPNISIGLSTHMSSFLQILRIDREGMITDIKMHFISAKILLDSKPHTDHINILYVAPLLDTSIYMEVK